MDIYVHIAYMHAFTHFFFQAEGEGTTTPLSFPLSRFLPDIILDMGWLRLVGSLKLYVSFAKEPYKSDDILQKRPMFLRSLLIVATPYLKKISTMCITSWYLN